MTKIDINKFKHKLDIEIRFMDLDALRHVNNARYLNFLEEARIAYSQEKLNLFNNIDELNVLVARIEIDFIKPIHYKDKLSVYTRINRLGNKSFTFESVFCVEQSTEAVIVSRALQTLVAIDVKKGSSIEIPEQMRQKIKSIENLED